MQFDQAIKTISIPWPVSEDRSNEFDAHQAFLEGMWTIITPDWITMIRADDARAAMAYARNIGAIWGFVTVIPATEAELKFIAQKHSRLSATIFWV